MKCAIALLFMTSLVQANADMPPAFAFIYLPALVLEEASQTRLGLRGSTASKNPPPLKKMEGFLIQQEIT